MVSLRSPARTPLVGTQLTDAARHDEAIELVKRAGPSTKVRLRLDLQTLAAVGACLRELGRPLTLEEMLSDTARAELDRTMAAAGRDDRYRSNRRGALARLQACHRGLPWRS